MKTSAALDPDTETHVGNEPTLDDEWRGLVAEAAAAAGMERDCVTGGPRGRGGSVRVGVVRPPVPRIHRGTSDRGAERITIEVLRGIRAPDRAVSAELDGGLLAGADARAVSADVDLEARDLRLTCQSGQFRVHDQAVSSFPNCLGGPFGCYNVARAGIVASIPAQRLGGLGAGKVVAGVCVPMSFDNTLQRVWRLAVPSRDMLRSDDRAHLAVAGLRGRIDLRVGGASGAARATHEFVRRSLSAHRPGDPEGFGPVKGMHMLEVDVERLEPGADLEIVVEVTLTSLLAGNPDDYEPGSPFYAGIDFGGGGSVRLPKECLSSFEIPLTPLIDNAPISVAHLGFVPNG